MNFFESMKAILKCQFESCSKDVPYEGFRTHADSCPENPRFLRGFSQLKIED